MKMGKVREFQALGGWFKKKKEEKCKGLRTSVPLLNKHYAPQDLDWKNAKKATEEGNTQ